MSRDVISWERQAVVLTTEVPAFLARVVSEDPSYISHGEIQSALSLDGEGWAPDLRARYVKALAHIGDDQGVLIARGDTDQIVAVACVTWAMKEAEAPYAVLEDLAVEPQARTQGLGTKMLTEIEAEAKRRGCLWLFLESGRKNNAAHVFFERAGFNLISQVFMKRLPKKT